jgi:hypothetical protein
MQVLNAVRYIADSARAGYATSPAGEGLRPDETALREKARTRVLDIESGPIQAPPRDDRYASRRQAEWEQFTDRRWQAPAGMAFAAQLMAQDAEPPPSGPYFEEYPPAIRAYERAAGGTALPKESARVTGLPIWV